MLAIYICLLFCSISKGEEAYYTLNYNKVLHTVNDKFLSISIDPAVLLAGVNLSETSLTLAKHVSPGYVRLVGPSTPFVKYVEDEPHVPPRDKDTNDAVYITPSMWFGINEWFRLVNLTPVFGINDEPTERGVWNPEAAVPLLELLDKFGIECYWQLGLDCSNKTLVQYVENLNILRRTLDKFPDHNGTWRILGSDISSCLSGNVYDERLRADLDATIDALMWHSPIGPRKEMIFKKTTLWTSVPKDSQPITFRSAVNWAVKVGEAAATGFDVIFREPRLIELTSDTPVYWFSFFYKKLIGPTVLDIKAFHIARNVFVYAYCSKLESNGSVTLLMINNASETSAATVRLGSLFLEKYMEVQQYTLSVANNDKWKVAVNGETLSMASLETPVKLLEPKIVQAKIRASQITFELPPESIVFNVIARAQCRLCGEIKEDFPVLRETNLVQVTERRHDIPNIYNSVNQLDNIKTTLLKELEADKKFYQKGQARQYQPNAPKMQNLDKSQKEMQFTVSEIEDILKRRAKARAASKNIHLDSAELDLLIKKATLQIPKRLISKRDINTVLLEEKANFYKNNRFSQETFERLHRSKTLVPKLHWPKLHKRDINLDLLKQRTNGLSQRKSIATQPNYLKSLFQKRDGSNLHPAGSEEDQFLEDIDDDESLMRNSKPPINQPKLFQLQPKVPKVNRGKATLSFDDYFQVLKASPEVVRDYDGVEGSFNFLELYEPSNGRGPWNSKYGDDRERSREEPLFLCDEFDDGIYRRKRNSLLSKDGLGSSKRLVHTPKSDLRAGAADYTEPSETGSGMKRNSLFKDNEVDSHFFKFPVYSWETVANWRDPLGGARQKRYIDDDSSALATNQIGNEDIADKSSWQGVIPATGRAGTADSSGAPAASNKIVATESGSYLRRILGRNRAEPIEAFLRNVETKIKSYLKTLFAR